jgi:hypothetical protein
VLAHFVFVDDGKLLAGMTFGALAGGFDKIGVGLVRFNAGTGALDKKRSQNQREADG